MVYGAKIKRSYAESRHNFAKNKVQIEISPKKKEERLVHLSFSTTSLVSLMKPIFLRSIPYFVLKSWFTPS